MATLREWLDLNSGEAPEVADEFRHAGDALLDRLIQDPECPWPWNTSWSSSSAPRWLLSFLRGDVDLATDGIASGALLPAPEEAALATLARHATARAARVFILHGNVRDLQFDGHLGYAPLVDVLETHWLESSLFGTSTAASALIRFSVSSGPVLGERTCALLGDRHSLTSGLEAHRRQTQGQPPEQRLLSDLAFLGGVLQAPESPRLLVLLERSSLLFRAGAEQLRNAVCVDHVLRWAAPGGMDPRHLVLLSVEALEELDPELTRRSNGLLQVHVPRPARAVDRRRFLLACMAASGGGQTELPYTRIGTRLEPMPLGLPDLDQAVSATAGLNYVGMEASLLNILERDLRDFPQVLDYLGGQRTELLRSESDGMLEVCQPRVRAEDLVGGLGEELERLRWILRAMAGPSGEGHRHLVPMGLLFVGVPGTGKSLLAEALASECAGHGVHFVRLGDFRDMWVGRTERNFSQVLRVIETFGRVIVFMDEVDQTEGGSRSGEARHETSQRVFGRLLQFMAEPRHRGRILWIAATNRPGRLDPAMLRPGRFDCIVPFHPPGAGAAAAILSLHLGRCSLSCHLDEAATRRVAEQAAGRGLTGAELELVVTEAGRRALAAGRAAIAEGDLVEVLEAYNDAHKVGQEYRLMVEDCQRFTRFRPPAGALA